MLWLRRSTPAEGQAGLKAHDGPQGSVHGRPEIDEEMRGLDRGGRGHLSLCCIPLCGSYHLFIPVQGQTARKAHARVWSGWVLL